MGSSAIPTTPQTSRPTAACRSPHLRAKAEADARVAASTLDWTIVRPGVLTDDPGTGMVDVSTALGRRSSVPRDDTALVLAETLAAPNTVHLAFELFSGDTPAREAVRSLNSPNSGIQREPRTSSETS